MHACDSYSARPLKESFRQPWPPFRLSFYTCSHSSVSLFIHQDIEWVTLGPIVGGLPPPPPPPAASPLPHGSTFPPPPYPLPPPPTPSALPGSLEALSQQVGHMFPFRFAYRNHSGMLDPNTISVSVCAILRACMPIRHFPVQCNVSPCPSLVLLPSPPITFTVRPSLRPLTVTVPCAHLIHPCPHNFIHP